MAFLAKGFYDKITLPHFFTFLRRVSFICYIVFNTILIGPELRSFKPASQLEPPFIAICVYKLTDGRPIFRVKTNQHSFPYLSLLTYVERLD